MKLLTGLGALFARQDNPVARAPGESHPGALQVEVERLTPIFAQMQDGGFDPSTPLLWGYFFLHPTRPPLVLLQRVLEARGFQTAAFEQVDKRLFQLHVETVEVHSPATLGARNLEFHALAKDHLIELYDGWDVGRPTTPVH